MEEDIAKQILSGEKKLKALGEKELAIRGRMQKLQENRKALEARLGLMKIEADMARDGKMKAAVQEQVSQLVQKLKDNSEEVKKENRELETILGFREQLQEAIAAQKRQNQDAAQIAETEGKNQEYEEIIEKVIQLSEEYNQLREHLLNRFEEIKLLNRRTAELKLEIDKLRGIPEAKKNTGHITNFVTQTVTVPFFDLDEKLLKLDPLTKY
ncbi:MAG TPA: hypothetical protein PL110_00030 [Candidatus Eremiobacteraeota bacterium]|mgnify:CR=1 FL=1|nr:MAG: hypothetical protein BWY64_00256 [bacterium ADurb.Bin363]HPZ06472.1 hypothetical protein [Candidatus Eremiobacteraeota bacterium]